jgi:hypothetical protein
MIVVPISTVLFFVLSPTHTRSESTYGSIAYLVVYLAGTAFAVSVIAVFYTRFKLLKWRCPRCGEPFHLSALFNQWAIYFQTACVNCGLDVGAVPK